MVHYNQIENSTIITLLPNRSSSWAETRLFVLVICGVVLAIGTFWAFVGAWVILPFSFLEAGLVAFLLYRVCLATYQRQVITFTPGLILVQTGKHFPKRSLKMQRGSAYLSVAPARHPLAPPVINISDGKASVELGGFLNRNDKTIALEKLKSAGLFIREYTRAQPS